MRKEEKSRRKRMPGKLIEKSLMIDRIHWDEADLKAKSLIYLSPGAEAT